MDTVDFVLSLIGALVLSNIGLAVLAARNYYRAEAAQKENARLVAQQRWLTAPYDTGLIELKSSLETQASTE